MSGAAIPQKQTETQVGGRCGKEGLQSRVPHGLDSKGLLTVLRLLQEGLLAPPTTEPREGQLGEKLSEHEIGFV